MSKRHLRIRDIMDITDGNDSDIVEDEDSEVSDDDDEYQPVQPQSSDESDDSLDDNNIDNPGFIPVAVRYRIPPSTSTGTSSAVEPQPPTSRGKGSASGPPSKPKRVKPTYNWKNFKFEPHEFTGQIENNDFLDALPLTLFSKFISEDMLKMVVEQTNLYSFQTTGKVIKLDLKELRQTIGMYLMMGVIRLDSKRDYWVEETRIADIIVRNRFQTILANIHFADNQDESIQMGKIWKISPWLEKLKTQCLNATPPTEYSSVDEMMVPFQGKFSKIKQYVKGKPHPWGFKIWARTDSDGILQDFELYQGKTETIPPTATRSAANAANPRQPQPAPRSSASPRSNTNSPTPTLPVLSPMTKLQRLLADASSFGLGTDTVLRLSATLPEDQNYKVCADNFFSGVQLVEKTDCQRVTLRVRKFWKKKEGVPLTTE